VNASIHQVPSLGRPFRSRLHSYVFD